MRSKIKVFLFIIISVLLLPSCSIGIKTPTDLVKKPKLSVDETRARDVIAEYLSTSAVSVRPLRPGELSAVGYLDWDEEDGSEVYSFYKNAKSHTAGLLLLKKTEGAWELAGSVEIPGEDIAYAKFIDLNLDNTKDLIIGTEAKEGAYNIINAFVWKNGQFENVWQETFTEFVIDNLDDEGEQELIVVKFDRGVNSSIACYRYRDEGMVLLDELAFDKYISGYYSVIAAKATADRRALFLDFSLGSKSATNVVVLENDKLMALIDPLENAQDYSHTSKLESVKSRDVDQDMLIEIPSEYTIKFSSGDGSTTDDIYLWRQLEEDELGFYFVDKAMSYINPNYNYEFLFPEEWMKAASEGELAVIKSKQSHSRDFISFYMLGEQDKMNLIFTIESFDDEKYEKWQNNEHNKVNKVLVLATYLNRKVIAYYPDNMDRVGANDRNRFIELMLSDNQILSSFRQLN